MANSTDFRVILNLTNGGSGGHLLADMLVNLAGNLGLSEVYNPKDAGGIPENGPFLAKLQTTLGTSFSDRDQLGDFIVNNRVKFFNALCKTAKDLGFESLSCQIFPDQIRLDELQQILSRADLRVIFLVRRRIDRHISQQNGQIVHNVINTDTTAPVPEFDLKAFLQSAMQIDVGMDQFFKAVQTALRPFCVLEYDRDLNIPIHSRNERVAQALKNIGALGDFVPHPSLNPITKQDIAQDWRDTIKNGFSAATGLAGLGLLDYAEAAPLMDTVPTKGDHVMSHAQFLRTGDDVSPRRNDLLQQGGYWRAFATDPIVSMTSLQFGRSFFAEWMAGPFPAFKAKAGVHFLKPTWSMQTKGLDGLGQTLRRAEQDNPGHIFIAMHVNDAEAENYRKSGIMSILGNIGIFEDEQIWAEDAPPMTDVPDADALMIAALKVWKNHHLASDLGLVNFVYGNPSDENFARVRNLCPKATFVNHRNGAYSFLQRHELRAIMSRSKVFLALSKEEGTMRATIESLLSGLPIVSTPSIGGRDAFFARDNALVVDPTPQGVRQGVRDMIARHLSRDDVRRATMEIIRPMRRDFELAANQAIAAHLGPLAPEFRVRDVFGLLTEYRPMRSFVEGLRQSPLMR